MKSKKNKTHCELCGKILNGKWTIIKNRINGNELTICKECVEKFGFT